MKRYTMAAAAGLAALALTGCGSSEPNLLGTVDGVGQACTVMTVSVLDLQWPLLAWRSGGLTPEGKDIAKEWSTDGGIPVPSIDDSDPTQVKVQAAALRVRDLAKELQTAVDEKDDARAQQIVDEAKSPLDDFIALCSAEPDWSAKSSVVDLRADLDRKPGN